MKLLKALLAGCAAASLPAPAMGAAVDGLSIRSTVQGEGQTIILVHGWTCDESSWDGQVPALMHEYRVVTLDLPGHGKSDSPASVEDYSVDLFAAAVEAVRAELGAEKVVLVGHSMGAGVIRKFALNYPHRVAGLIAVDATLDVRPWAKRKREPVTRERRAATIERMFVEATPVHLRTRIRTMMMSSSEMTAEGGLAAMAAPENQSNQIISAPALTVWGEKKQLDPQFDTRDMVPRWQEVQMPGTGHFLMMEQPHAFNAILRRFVEERAEF